MALSNDPASIPLAIVGMGCRLPEAENLDAFWNLLIEGRSAVREMPPDRMDQELYYDPEVGKRNKSYSKLAAVLTDRTFNHEACPISDELASSVDNTHLLMCETAAAALKNAAMDPFNLPLRNTGVYVGHVHGSTLGSDYTFTTCMEEAADFLNNVEGFQQLRPEEQQALMHGLVNEIRATRPRPNADSPDVSSCMVAGTVAQAFDLTGPFMALDSACASSLQAMLLGARALQLGQIDMAIVGGASDTKATTMVLFSTARSMSATGSRPFDEDADGLICGEGYVALVMKTLERALADGDPIQAVVRGLGVSSDGKGKSLWAPRKEGQIEAMRRAYRGGLDMSNLQYIEAHATATQVGDATELQTLSDILKPVLPEGHKIPIGAVKGNIGHTLESAGLSSVIKTVLAMQHKMVPPAINIRRLNPKIDWENVPVFVPRSPVAWPETPASRPRCAGVNAFGIGGLNMHVALEEYHEATHRQLIAPTLSGTTPAVPTAIDYDRDAIAVVGMGCLFAGAADVDQYWDLIKSGRDPKQKVPADRWRIPVVGSATQAEPHCRDKTVGGFITDFEYDWRAHKVPPKQVANADPLQFMLLDVTDQAMRDAGYHEKPFDRTRTGVMVGSEFGGDFAFQLQMGLRLPEIEKTLRQLLAQRGITGDQATAIVEGYSTALLKDWTALIDETGSFTASTLASRLTKSWNLMGGAVAVDSGVTAGLSALNASVNSLLAGDADMMICASGQRRMGIPEYEMLTRNGMLASGESIRSPLDAQGGKLVPGEGVGVLVLKRLSKARKDGDRIRAIIRGIGAAHGKNWGEALQLAMERSFQRAHVEPSDLAIMEFDGCGTALWNQHELQTVVAVHQRYQRRQPLLISSVTSQIGHTEGVSGIASLIKANLELEHGEVPATLGLEQPVSTLAEQPSVTQAVNKAAPIRLTTEDGRRLGGVSSCSRRLAYHLVVERGEKVPVEQQSARAADTAAPRSVAAVDSDNSPLQPVATATATSAWRICHLGAASVDELLRKLDDPAVQSGALYDAPGKTGFAAQDQFRLAVVADSGATCRRKVELARKQLTNPAAQPLLEQQGIFFRQLPASAPRVALVFAGQGSQYTGMLREVVRDVPAAAAAKQEVDGLMTRLGHGTFAQLAWDDNSRLGTEIWPTQVSLLLADHIMHRVLADRGVRADLVLGHSYGEYPALLAGGAWDLETAVQVTRARCTGAEMCSDSKLMATTATPEVLKKLNGQVRGDVYVAIQNAPDQLVVGGTEDRLKQLATLLEAESYKARILPVPCAFHTPLVEAANRVLEPAVRSARIQSPQIPTYSWVTQHPAVSAEEIRSIVMAHYTTPLWYVEFIRRIAAETSTVFVEVGPSQVLTRLHRQILDGSEVMAVSCDNPKRPGVEQLCCVQALLECVGALKPVDELQDSHPATAMPQLKPMPEASSTRPQVVHFDATARRREKMRNAAATQGVSPPNASNAEPSVSVERVPAAPADVATAPDVLPVSPPESGTGTAASSVAELETFLIAFVVEQTGYPAEVVELDADLEADLGIDSIKKAQLFGELQDYFDVTRTDDLTLDNFPTLRHVVDFLADVPPKKPLTDTEPTQSDAEQTPTPPAATTPATVPAVEVAEPAAAPVTPTEPGPGNTTELETFLINFVVEQTGYPPEVVELDADLEADLGIDSIKKAQLFGELQDYFDVSQTDDLTLDDFPTLRHMVDFLADVPPKKPLTDTEPAQSDAEQTPASPAATAPAAVPAAEIPQPAAADVPPTEPSPGNTTELETFLINFVVEQTGYPPEVVELDADLEADLGIDSIKKAQLFGELQDYFDVTQTDDLTLDDFPTLRHMVDFLSDVPPKKTLTDTEPTQSDAEQTPTPPAATTLATVPAVEVAEPAAAPITPTEPGPGNTAELETFLINFVVEQTGYPPEVVELDADLEADLGIDSIKKAQLFGELQDYFDVSQTDDLTLDDFPTLRHVVDFLADVPSKKPLSEDADEPIAAAESISISPPVAQPISTAAEPSTAPSTTAPQNVPTAKADTASTGLRQIELRGTPYEMGYQHGQQMRDEIRRSLRRMADLAGTDGAPTVSPEAIKDPSNFFSADELSELEGIAAAAQVPFGNILALNLALRSAVKDAPQLLVQTKNNDRSDAQAATNGQPARHAQLEGHIVPVVQSRHPSGTAAHTVLSLAGVCGDLNGAAAVRPDTPPSIDSAARKGAGAKYDHEADAQVEPFTCRFEMRMLEVSLPPQVPSRIEGNGAALVLGDNVVADAMRQRLANDGIAVVQLQPTGDIDADLAAFEKLWQKQPILHLFVATGRDAEASQLCGDAAWDRRYQCGVLWPLLLCQRWIQRVGEANLLDQSTLASIVNLGGDFGFSASAAAPEGGALTGLMKAIFLEKVEFGGHGGMCIKAIDAPAAEPAESLVENTLRELAGKTVDYEVAFVDGRRYLQNAYSSEAAVADYAEIQAGETWVVTGGARGITAECAMELGRRFGLKLHLIGMSSIDSVDPAWRNLSADGLQQLRSQTMIEARKAGQTPNEAWQQVEKQLEIDRSLRRFAEAGIQATYHACDVSDRDALAAALHKIRQSDGPIAGILHGAGIDRSCRFEKKTRDTMLATLGAKAVGAYNLMELTRHDPVQHFIGLGSISGRLGSYGQADYCAASDMLCKLISWYRAGRADCRAVGFHFHPWDEIGMAAKPEIKAVMKAAGGPAPMPKCDGVRQFLREVYAGLPCSEVLITTPEYHERFYGSGQADELQPTAATDAADIEQPQATTSQSTVASSPQATDATQRLVMRMIDAPLPDPGARPPIHGAAAILGDNPTARALQKRLRELGAEADIIPTDVDPQRVIAAFDQLWQRHPIVHLFLMTPYDSDAGIIRDEAQFTRRRNGGVLVPFMLAQHWLAQLAGASLLEGASLLAATALGGDFGITGKFNSAESGGLTGLIKSLYIEGGREAWQGVKMRAVDFDASESPEAVAHAICTELACDLPDLEVGYPRGRRHAVRVVPQPAKPAAVPDINQGGTWVITGGARGVTAVVGQALGQRFGLKLHVLGSSPAPEINDAWRDLSETGLKKLQVSVSRQAHAEGRSPRDAWKQVEKALEMDRCLQAYRQAGVRVTYHCCDVADRDKLAAVLDRIRQTDGPIDGIVHGAGMTIDARFSGKKQENVLRTVRTKVDGAAALMALTAQDPVRYFISFGSVAGRFGAKGQTDYAAANDMLCKQMARLRTERPDCRAIGIHWHAWDEVGMAVQPDVKAVFESMDYRLMPTSEGVAHLVGEILAGGPDSEVIFTDTQHYRDKYPLPIVAADEQAGRTGGTISATNAPSSIPQVAIDALPLIDRVLEYRPGQRVVAEAKFHPAEDPFLIDHQMGGRPLLPAVVAMEVVAEAATLLDGRRFVGLRDVEIFAGLPFNTDDPRTAKVVVSATPGGAACRMTSDYYDRKGRLVEADRLVMTATVELADAPAELSIPHCGPPPLGWFPMEYPPGFAVKHGPRMRYLKNVFCQYDGAFGRIVVPPISELAGNRRSDGWLTSPAVLDASLVACSTFGFVMFEKRNSIPLGLKQMRVFGLPRDGEECVVRTYYRGKDARHTHYDFVLFGEDQRVILAADGYLSSTVQKRKDNAGESGLATMRHYSESPYEK